ncbi:hypothetical protein PR202_ga13979 [Eleusine coracana subsp. coracana]|uniref:Uncharacterized protein n=1 Tax=Eleusine coracana subsp. coracana TaxID=191504 RepID=A0AAV5CFZ0_ELECO|nr:hypothetical protein PR202_ga13979 [Eleusine coracana subsp. coracana]
MDGREAPRVAREGQGHKSFINFSIISSQPRPVPRIPDPLSVPAVPRLSGLGLSRIFSSHLPEIGCPRLLRPDPLQRPDPREARTGRTLSDAVIGGVCHFTLLSLPGNGQLTLFRLLQLLFTLPRRPAKRPHPGLVDSFVAEALHRTDIFPQMQKLSMPLLFLSVTTTLSERSSKRDDEPSSNTERPEAPSEANEMASTSSTRDVADGTDDVVSENWLMLLFRELEKQGITLPER